MEQISEGKKEQVRDMFNRIARHYDFLNHFLSLGIDKTWRRQAIDMLKREKPATILDVATGTADLAIEALRLAPEKIIGVDISEEMLILGQQKIRSLSAEQIIELRKGDSELLPFEDDIFDAVTVAFGVRNFEDLDKGLREMLRVLKSNGTLVALEFSQPKGFPFTQLFHFYFHNLLPLIGRFFSKDRRAYAYLPQSVEAFPSGEEFMKKLENAGFALIRCIPLTFGVCSLYVGKKKPSGQIPDM
jgi:demethylmenaquinone methyltransferase / 2-methoxy-6-polyprenyl-1,4-benzoquinol methylase